MKNKSGDRVIILIVVAVMILTVIELSITVVQAISIYQNDSYTQIEASTHPQVIEAKNKMKLKIMERTHQQLLLQRQEEQRKILLENLDSLEENILTFQREIEENIESFNALIDETEEYWSHFNMESVQINIQSLNQMIDTREEMTTKLEEMRDEFSYLADEELIAESEEVEEVNNLLTEVEIQLQQWSEISPEFEKWETVPDVMELIEALSSDQRYDVELMANCLYFEGGNTSEAEMLRIGSVVMNRTISSYYPDTISGVLYDTRWSVQYSSTGSFFSTSLPIECYEIAYRLVILGERTTSFGSDVVGQTGLNLNPGSTYFELVYTSEWHQYWCRK